MLTSTTALMNRNTPLFDWYLMPEAYSAPLVYEAIEEFGVAEGETVLDPFCGTGTTLVAAKMAGRNGLGIEVNPFLCFASRVKSRDCFDLPLLRLETKRVMADAHLRLDRVCDDMNQRAALLPDMPRLERWIARKVACKIIVLRECITEQMSEENRDVPMLALASILRGASNMKLSPHAFGSREVKQDAPVLAMFEMKLTKMLGDIEWLQGHEHDRPLGRAEVVQGDIRAMSDLEHPLLPARLAIGSPPYLNNLDYTMQTRMELFFLGFVNSMDELKSLRKRMMISDAKATYRDIRGLAEGGGSGVYRENSPGHRRQTGRQGVGVGLRADDPPVFRRAVARYGVDQDDAGPRREPGADTRRIGPRGRPGACA